MELVLALVLKVWLPSAAFITLCGVALSRSSARNRSKRFQEIFGFAPPTKKDGGRGIRLLQGDVNAKLRALASHLESEESSLANVKVQERLQRMRELQQERKDFFRTLRLIERFGFETKQTTHEYTRGRTIHHKEID